MFLHRKNPATHELGHSLTTVAQAHDGRSKPSIFKEEKEAQMSVEKKRSTQTVAGFSMNAKQVDTHHAGQVAA